MPLRRSAFSANRSAAAWAFVDGLTSPSCWQNRDMYSAICKGNGGMMSFIENLAQLDWTRGVRMWILVAAALAACEAGYLFHRAVFRSPKGADDVR